MEHCPQSGDVVRFSFLFILISFRRPFVLLPWPGSVEMKLVSNQT